MTHAALKLLKTNPNGPVVTIPREAVASHQGALAELPGARPWHGQELEIQSCAAHGKSLHLSGLSFPAPLERTVRE